MGSAFETFDIVIFFVFVIGVMAFGLFASRREGRSSEEYFLAGRNTRWWGVAASIYGSNVSANHLVGMLGVGFGVGFAQSHFELGGHAPGTLRRVAIAIVVSVAIFAVLGALMVGEVLTPTICGVFAAVWTIGISVKAAATARARDGDGASSLLAQDRVWAGLLCGVAIFMLYYFY